MTTSERISLISAIAAVIQALFVIGSLVFIALQTAALRKTTDEMERSAKLSSYTNLRSNIHDINKLLLKHDGLAEWLGFTERDLLAFIIINYFELVYLEWRYGVLDEPTWRAQEKMLGKNVTHSFVQGIWPDHKDELHPDFVEYVEDRWGVMKSLKPRAPKPHGWRSRMHSRKPTKDSPTPV